MYTYEVVSEYNTFGAHLGYRVYLYRKGQELQSWFFDDLWFAKKRVQKKISWLRDIYGATPV